MGRIYRVPFTGTLTAAGANTDLLLAKPAADKPIRLAGWILGQTSESGDAMEENVRITVQYFPATITDGTGGSSVTPAKTEELDPAAGFTARCNDAAVATTSGTAVIKEEIGWNIRNNPWERFIPEEQRLVARLGAGLVVRLESTLADDVVAALTFLIEEF